MDRDRRYSICRFPYNVSMYASSSFRTVANIHLRFDDRRGGESYRPSDRIDRSASRDFTRSPWTPARNRSPRPLADTWVPSGGRPSDRPRSRSPPPSFRRRSRSPPPYRNRDAGIGYRGRTRSPPRRLSPRRDQRIRSPNRHSWRGGSPYSGPRSPRASRPRSPPKRIRGHSPSGRYSRSPRRERYGSPASDRHTRAPSPARRGITRGGSSRGGFSTRSRSPTLRDRGRESFAANASRRRSPTPPRQAPSTHASAQGSTATSQRSSPRIHPDRLSVPASEHPSHSPASRSDTPRRDSRPRDTPSSHMMKSPSEDQGQPSQEQHQTASPNTMDLSVPRSGERGRDGDASEITRRSSKPYAPTVSVPPSGPQALRRQSNASWVSSTPTSREMQLPSGPSNSFAAASTAGRGSNISLLSAPTRPRGGPSFSNRESPREPSWAATAPPPPRRGPIQQTYHGTPPTGPRGSFAPPPLGYDSSRHPQYRRSSSTSGIHPRAQKVTNHLSGLPAIIAGGKLLPSPLDPATERRLSQLETDQEKLFEQVAEKQRLKRAVLRDWDKLDRESATGALRSELAEGHLQRMAEGESIGGGTAF